MRSAVGLNDGELTEIVNVLYDAIQQASQRVDERYVVIPSREHEYYTIIRESWNSKVLSFRNTVLDVLQVKK